MNHSVPNFEIDDDYPNIPTTSGIITSSKKSAIVDEDIMELIWQNGQVIAQSQNQRSQTVAASAPPVFIQEDEMATWIQYPLDGSSFERDLYDDFLYTTPSSSVVTAAVPPPVEIDTTTVEIRSNPSPSQLRCTEGEFSQRLQNFGHFSRLPKAKSQNCTSTPGNTARASTIVDSNETPIAEVSRVSNNVASVSAGNGGGRTTTYTTTAAAETSSGREISTTACEFTGTSSASGSRGSVSAGAEPPLFPQLQEAALTPAEDRKRKGRESDNEEHGEDAEFEAADAKKQTSSSTSTKRSRAAEVHNLSERRRRDRINEKMKALQELIPRCNKSDKASMLDEAIEYLKSLQMQVQMMSMGCSMVPMMYPGIPQYMPTTEMGMRMGMGTGMGMNRPMVPYPSLMPGPAMQNAAAAVAQMTPRFPVPAYHLPPVPVPDPSRIRAMNQPDHPMMKPLVGLNANQPRLPSLSDPYQQYYALHKAQVLPQNQRVEQPSSCNPSSRKEESPANHQTG